MRVLFITPSIDAEVVEVAKEFLALHCQHGIINEPFMILLALRMLCCNKLHVALVPLSSQVRVPCA